MQNNQQERSRMMGTMPMGKLVPTISIPIMISMLVQALYNVVDSIFVARFDVNALAAVSLAFPVQMLMAAVSVGLGTGINSLLSRKLGEKRAEEARVSAWNGVLLELSGFLIFFVFGIFFAEPCFNLLTADPVLRQLGTSYLRIVTIGSLGIFMAILMERMMQSTGNSTLSMVTQLLGAVTNIILDPILIFGYLGFPSMGIAGAAVATIIGQWVSMIAGLVINQSRNKELKLDLSECRPNIHIIRDILAVGFPSIIMQSIASVMNILFNGILTPYGASAISVLGVYFKLQSFIFMPVFGLGNGLVAIVGYNYGARLKARIYEAIKVAAGIALGIMAAGTLAFLLMPGALMSLFEAGESGELSAIGIPALRIISTHFLMAAVGITLSTVFQAIGKGFYSMIISLCRQLIVLIPAAWILSGIGGLNAVWWAFPISEVVSLTLCIIFYRRCDRKLISVL